jgi:hypothetical protein
MGVNAREFLSKSFLKKEDLRRSGPLRLTVESVEVRDGRSWDGKPPVSELVLRFTDGQQLSLRAQENLRRVLEAWGDETDGWVGRTLEAYYSPDVRSPRGEPGGVRLRMPSSEGAGAGATPQAAPRSQEQELEESIPF